MIKQVGDETTRLQKQLHEEYGQLQRDRHGVAQERRGLLEGQQYLVQEAKLAE